jgi:hypothetical protein
VSYLEIIAKLKKHRTGGSTPTKPEATDEYEMDEINERSPTRPKVESPRVNAGEIPDAVVSSTDRATPDPGHGADERDGTAPPQRSSLFEAEQVLPGADMAEPRRCYACKGYLFWHSVHGAIICATCHPPASPRLVSSWCWGNLPEGSA